MSDDARYNVIVLLIAAVVIWAYLEFAWQRRTLSQLDYRLSYLHEAARPILAEKATVL